MAFTSSKPGRTQMINFYRVDGKLHFVDLPGYGFARVPLDSEGPLEEPDRILSLKRNTLAAVLSCCWMPAAGGWSRIWN